MEKEMIVKIEKYLDKDIELKGWIRNHRKQKEFGFIDFSDGTCFKHIQLVYDNSLKDFETIQKYHNGSAITVIGTVDQVRIFLITSTPSMSGSPRSNRISSGACVAASIIA